VDRLKEQADVQELAAKLASVSNNSKKTDILIFGAGIGGLATLEALKGYDGVHIVAIVDVAEDAPAFELAREMGVQISTDADATLASFKEGIVIDVTGDPGLYRKLDAFSAPLEIELISAKSAKLLFDLANHQLRDELVIQKQNTRMDMLDSMLGITLLLDDKPSLAEVTSKSFEDIHTHIKASKGLAVMFGTQVGDLDIIAAVGENKPKCSSSTCDFGACKTIRTICGSLTKQNRFKELDTPIRLSCCELETSYNTILPVWQDTLLAGALLFSMQEKLDKEQRTTLEMASVHLNMTYKTLDHLHKLEKMAIFDSLTGVFNRRKFDMQLQHEVNRTKRTHDGTLSCGFIDVDDFKYINDNYGHEIGDQILKLIAEAIRNSIRDYDICARYGGDEFVILIPADDAMENEGLEVIGKRILEKVAHIRIANHPEIRTGVSVGICTQSSETVDSEKLMKQADDALYLSKKAGKGCLRILSNEQYRLHEPIEAKSGPAYCAA